VYFSFNFAKPYISQKKTYQCKNGHISPKQAFFTKQKHCLNQLFGLNHHSKAEIRDFLEIVCILASTSENDTYHRKKLANPKMLKLPENKRYSQNISIA